MDLRRQAVGRSGCSAGAVAPAPGDTSSTSTTADRRGGEERGFEGLFISGNAEALVTLAKKETIAT
jgi:hypothetical protein